MVMYVKKCIDQPEYTNKLNSCYESVNKLMDKYGGVRLDGTTASYATIDDRRSMVDGFVRTLHKNKFRITDINHLNEKHCHVLISSWLQRNNKANTIQNKLSVLRVLESWIGKPNLTNSAIESYPDKEHFLKRAKKPSMKDLPDRSLSGNDVNIIELIEKAREIEPLVAIQMTLQYIFGLRVKESMLFRPVNDAAGALINVNKGPKGGRKRQNVPPLIVPESAEKFLAELQVMVGHKRGVSLIPKGKDLKKWKNRYYYVMKKIGCTKKGLGVTSHSNRHEYVQGRFEILCDEAVRVAMRQGDGLDIKTRRHNAKLQLQEDIGHGRINTSGIYGL